MSNKKSNNIIQEVQTVSQEVCDNIEKVIKALNEVHTELNDIINEVYYFCANHTDNENFNQKMYMNSLYNPDKFLERLLGEPIYSKGLDQYCCAITYDNLTPDVHTKAVSMFIPSKWVDYVDSCKILITSELCNSMITHLGYCDGDPATNAEYDKLYEKVNKTIIDSGCVGNFYGIKEINNIISAYNATFERTDSETGISIVTIANELDDLYDVGRTFVRELCEINPRSQYELVQNNSYIHIRGLKGKNLYDSPLDDYVELIVPSDMYIRTEEDKMKYFTEYILNQIDAQVYEYKANIRKFLEKNKHYDRDFRHIMSSLNV